jgi:hypothetical protein
MLAGLAKFVPGADIRRRDKILRQKSAFHMQRPGAGKVFHTTESHPRTQIYV